MALHIHISAKQGTISQTEQTVKDPRRRRRSPTRPANGPHNIRKDVGDPEEAELARGGGRESYA